MIEKDTLLIAVFAGFFLYLICKIIKRAWELFGSIIALLAVISVYYLLVQATRSGAFDLHNPVTYKYLFNLSEIVSNQDYYSPFHESSQKLADSAQHIDNIYSLISTVKRRWADLYANG